jgi:hypothetical protein
MHIEHANPANTGGEVLLSFAPGFEGGGVQIRVSFPGKQTIQGLERMRRRIELPS